jgi:hypothetical protein
VTKPHPLRHLAKPMGALKRSELQLQLYYSSKRR